MSEVHSDRLIVVGAGLAGLATAIAANEKGFQVTLLESEAKLGGAAAYSVGMLRAPANHVMRRDGIEDNLDDAATYIRSTGSDYPELLDETAMHRWLAASGEAAEYFEELGVITWRTIPTMPDYFYPEAPGARKDGRFLTAVCDGADLREWRDRLLVSPHFPVGTTYDELFTPDLAGQMALAKEDAPEPEDSGASGYFSSSLGGSRRQKDLLTTGTGLVANFVLAAAARTGIDIRLQHTVTELLNDEGRVGRGPCPHSGRWAGLLGTRRPADQRLRLGPRPGQRVREPRRGGRGQGRTAERAG